MSALVALHCTARGRSIPAQMRFHLPPKLLQ